MCFKRNIPPYCQSNTFVLKRIIIRLSIVPAIWYKPIAPVTKLFTYVLICICIVTVRENYFIGDLFLFSLSVDAFSSNCSRDADCNDTGAYCNLNQCTCFQGYQTINSSCELVLESPCFSDDDCDLDFSICDVNTSLCVCDTGYSAINTTCLLMNGM